MVLAGFRLAGCETVEPRFAPSAALDDEVYTPNEVARIAFRLVSGCFEGPTRKGRCWSLWNETIPHGSTGATLARTDA